MATATATCPLPTAADVRSLVGDLVGKDVEVEPSRPRLRPLHLLAIAPYATTDGDLVAACLCDLAVAAAFGAALALVPPAIAQQSLTTGTLSAELAENVREVLNVASRWVNGEGHPRLVLTDLVAPGDQVPEGVLELVQRATTRVDLQVDVEGYGGGLLSVVAR